jgi:hypothetical protein
MTELFKLAASALNHHLDMSRDDGMDEPGIDWFCGCHLVLGYFGSKVGQITADFCQTPTTNLTQLLEAIEDHDLS